MRWLSWVLVAMVLATIAGGEFSAFDANKQSNPAIADDEFVTIGGIEQWISIRGENRENPVIVVLHGGPGEAQTPLEQLYVGWEKDFTVVQWDQRGAGKTFGRNGKSAPDMTLDRMVQDGIEVVEYIRRRLGKDKVIVLGHSWGSFLGINIIKKRPELFYAYVGTGQVVSSARTSMAQYAYTVKRAKAEENENALKDLRDIGPPPYEIGPKFFTSRKWFSRYLAGSDTKYIQSQMDLVRSAPDFSAQDVQDWVDGQNFSGRTLWSTMVASDLPATLGYDMPLPFFIIQGQDDHIAPTTLAVDYFRKIRAPVKKMVLIKGAGHFAYATNREEFLAALIDFVRPLAVRATAIE